ncbi:MAG: haloalkane dehalogenase [Bacteroidota bacterium]
MATTISATISAQDISEAFPFESRYFHTPNGNLHYVEDGEGDPVLFLHGVPMSAYSWRNVIPHLSSSHRCLAIDFMGFGQSDKPEIAYTFSDQLHYLQAFIDGLDLRNLTLVMTDIGGIIGTQYAMNHPERIKGLVFMETPLSDARTFHKDGGMMQRMMFWMSAKPRMGYKMIVKKNMFIKMMPMLIKRKLTAVEKARYEEPFQTKTSRLAMFAPPHSFPKKGKNVQAGDMGDFLNRNAAALQQSNLPKLLLYAKPGMLVNNKVRIWTEKNYSNLTTQYVGKAKHLMEEDLPHEIGAAISTWLGSTELAN